MASKIFDAISYEYAGFKDTLKKGFVVIGSAKKNPTPRCNNCGMRIFPPNNCPKGCRKNY